MSVVDGKAKIERDAGTQISECCDLIEIRRFIRGASRGCKVRFSQGDIIDSAVDAETGKPGDAGTGQPRS
jgi:hypothetical protein